MFLKYTLKLFSLGFRLIRILDVSETSYKRQKFEALKVY
jgi:hypothetical protein